jgi:phosphoserine phosphatase RsbU/P
MTGAVKTRPPVLVVEDSETVLRLTLQFLADLGFPAAGARNGAEAVAEMARSAYRLFIVDLTLPDIAGASLIRRIQKEVPDAVIIVQTGIDDTGEVLGMMRLGVYDYFIKPVEFALFKSGVHRAAEFIRLRHYEQEQTRRYRAELARIQEIQSSNLPDFSMLDDLDVCFSMLPAEDMSGDILDGFLDRDGRLVLFLCDVCGHGLASAYVANEVRSLFRLLYVPGVTPALLLGAVNELICSKKSSASYFTTAVVCVIDRERGELCCASAGHHPLLLRTGQSGEVTHLKPAGTMLGVFSEIVYESLTVGLADGDALLIYSDGIIEAINPSGEMYGIDRFVGAVTDQGTARDMVLDIVSDVFDFVEHEPQEDDMTLAVLHIKKAGQVSGKN